MSKKVINTLEDLKDLTEEITKLYFTKCFNEPINGLIPDWIKTMEFDFYSKFNYDCDMLPEGLEELYFGNYKKHTLEEILNFPKKLSKLIIGGKFNQEIKENVLPKNLTHLTFRTNFNQEIKENVLPKKLTHLIFGLYFNQEIKENILPLNLTKLTFGYEFNREIKENILPLNLTHLALGHYFNREIKENVLPKNLTHLTFGYEFNQEIKENVLPSSLKKIKIFIYNEYIDKILKNYPEFKYMKNEEHYKIYEKIDELI